MRSLRLLVTEKCHRSCEGCCNKDHDLAALPVVDWSEQFETIMLTGGEPLLEGQLPKTIELLKNLAMNEAKLIVYTSLSRNVPKILNLVDGVTLTLHEQSDVEPFLNLNEMIIWRLGTGSKSLRLNVFDGIQIPSNVNLSRWKVKDNIHWIKNCPLPSNEVFMRV